MKIVKQKRQRDSQQWILDWLVKTIGHVQNFAYDRRVLPPEVKSYRMIPRVLEKRARHVKQIAKAAEKHGHFETAQELYWLAAERCKEAQHAIFQDDNPEKIYLHDVSTVTSAKRKRRLWVGFWLKSIGSGDCNRRAAVPTASPARRSKAPVRAPARKWSGPVRVGERRATAQATHGSAPHITGRGIANPYAVVM